VSAGDGPSTDLHALLRSELSLRGWTRRHFARLLGVRESTVGRWLAADPAARVIPRPATVTHIARVLELDPTDLLRGAGYLEPATVVPFTRDPDIDEAFRARARRFRRLMRMVPPGRMNLALIILDVMLDALQSLISRLEDNESDEDEPPVP